MKALILSAGLGTRFRPVSEKLPKPAIPFLGLPIALYAVEYCLQLGATEFYFNTHHLPEKLEETLSPYLKAANLKFHFVNEKIILGSGGALKNLESELQEEEKFLLCNADELILPHKIDDFKDFIKNFEPTKQISSLLCTKHPEVGKRFGGVWVDSQNLIHAFGKDQIDDSLRGLHFMGLSVFSSKILDFLPEKKESNILYDGIMASLQENFQANAFELDCLWEELGNQKEFIEAHNVVFKHWQNPCTDIIKSCIKRFAPDTLKQQFLTQYKGVNRNFQSHRNDASEGGWNINLSGSEVAKLESYKECIFLKPMHEEETEKHQQIFI